MDKQYQRARLFAWVCALWIGFTAFVALTFGYYDLWLFWIAGGITSVVPALIFSAIPAIAIWIGVRRLRADRYRPAAFWLSVPVIAVSLAILCFTMGDAVVFRFKQSSYVRIVQEATAGRCSDAQRSEWKVPVDMLNCEVPVIVVFPWGGGLLSTWHGVVFDASDEIAKPPSRRSTAWRSTRAGAELENSGVRKSLGDHFYLGGGS